MGLGAEPKTAAGTGDSGMGSIESCSGRKKGEGELFKREGPKVALKSSGGGKLGVELAQNALVLIVNHDCLSRNTGGCRCVGPKV
jgi:hypothetical protein